MPAIALAIASGCSGGGGSTPPAVSPPPAAPSGVLDTSYGAAGVAVLPPGAGMAVDAAGDVFYAGFQFGKLDPSGRPALFEQNAVLAGYAPTIAVDSAGNLYAASVVNDSLIQVVKRDASGRPVGSFGQDGHVDLAFAGSVGLRTILLDGVGNVYVMASTHPPNFPRPINVYLIKLDSAGKPVATFGADGTGRITLPSVFEIATPVPAIDRAGNVFAVAPSFSGNVLVQKLDANGAPAADFATMEIGLGCTGVPNVPYTIRRFISVDASDNVFVGGACAYGAETRERPFVVKLDARGNLAASFGEGGIARDFYAAKNAAGTLQPTAVDAFVPASDGNLYVGVSTKDLECGVGVGIVKLGADGRPVDGFGSHGVAMVELYAGAAWNLGIDGMMRLYAGGNPRTACPAVAGGGAIYRFSG